MANLTIQQALALALEHHRSGRVGEAESLIAAMVAPQPDRAGALHQLGVLAFQAKSPSVAIDLIQRAIELKPSVAEYYSDLGGMLLAVGQAEPSIRTLRQALALDPESGGAHQNMAHALASAGQLKPAVAEYQRAIELRPSDRQIYHRLGSLLRQLGRVQEALNCYQKAVEKWPDYADAHGGLAHCLLTLGQLKRGWEEYEWRWVCTGFPLPRQDFGVPQWEGEALGGRRILVHAEQGLGDTLQFVRYVPLVASRGGKVVLQCDSSLHRLLKSVQGVEQIIEDGQALPTVDVHCPLLSLPRVFGTTLESIPAAVPYLSAEPHSSQRWRERLGSGLKVGLTWGGSALHQSDLQRSIALKSWLPLLKTPGVRFFSLQKGAPAAQIQSLPAEIRPIDWTGELNDFADTAALISGLDLVISVDTSVVHLAGAMSRPVWVLLKNDPDFRWLLDRPDSPWYPTARLFRQRVSGDWAEPMAEMADELARLALIHSAGTGRPSPSIIQEARGLYERGVHSYQERRLAEAADFFGRAVSLVPNDPAYLNGLGAALAGSGNIQGAVDAFRRAVELSPELAEAHNNLANSLRAAGKLDLAIESYEQAIRLRPVYPEAHFNFGNTLQSVGRLDEAVAAFRLAIQQQPNFPEAWDNLGGVLKLQGKLEEAIAAHRRALALRPEFPAALSNLGSALQARSELDEAIACYQKAIQLRADYGDAWGNLGSAFEARGDLEKALDAFQQDLNLRPQRMETHLNLASMLQKMGRWEEAIGPLRRALSLFPEEKDLHFALAMSLLILGDFEHGWPEYEWRLQRPAGQTARLDPNKPRWNGENPTGCRIMLHCEQGLGDTIQFVRYAPILARMGARVFIHCPPPLRRLLKSVEGIEQVVGQGEPLPDFDLQCMLLSLPALMKTTLQSIPSQIPYVRAEPSLFEQWQSRLAAFTGVKAGLVWSGNPNYSDDRRRSIQLAEPLPFLHVPGVTWISLQKGEPSKQIAQLPDDVKLVNWTDELLDFADTAALIAGLDVVIAVDTSVAHLAAAMGKPTWILLPWMHDFRWLLNRQDSPWYPNAKLFQQPTPGDWATPINQIASELLNRSK